DHGDQSGFSAARRADKQRHLAASNGQIDAAKNLNAGIAVAKFLDHAAALDGYLSRCDRWCLSQHIPTPYPRKTTAGSSTSTRRMLRRLERITITNTAPPAPAITCQGIRNPARRTIFLVDSKKVAASPMPMP